MPPITDEEWCLARAAEYDLPAATIKDLLLREGKRRSPDQAMHDAQDAVARGEQAGVFLIRTGPGYEGWDPDAQAEMMRLNVGGH